MAGAARPAAGETLMPSSAAAPRTLYDKIWSSHLVRDETHDVPAILYIDVQLLHEVTSPQAFAMLHERGLPVRRPDRHLATFDHAVPTRPAGEGGERPFVSDTARDQVETLASNARRHGIPLLDWEDPRRGVVHVVGPELGLTLPGTTIVCGDSHTATHGAFGALAFGIGTSEVAHVLATQTLLQRRSRTLRVTVDGALDDGVDAKDLVLYLISRLGIGGATGYVIEYAGSAIAKIGMEGRMTICNMSIEAGARAGMIAPDATTIEYLRGRAPMSPEAFERQAKEWLELRSDEGAIFDREVRIDASEVAPMATWGTTPDTAIGIDAAIPEPGSAGAQRALDYMGFAGGERVADHPIDVVFIGSCTNGRISDLRAAAAVLRGRRVHPDVTMLVVPGSSAVRDQAEAEGLDRVFVEAGADWRLPGCSMCIAMNGDLVPPGKRVVSTSNRNFEGRQGPGARTILTGPAVAAAAAVAGRVVDPRSLEPVDAA